MVRTQLIEKSKQDTLDKIIAVGEYYYNTHVELFSLSGSKWQIKKGYEYSKDISYYAILAFEKKFIIFGGFHTRLRDPKNKLRKVLTNQDNKM